MQQKTDIAGLFTRFGGNPENYQNLSDEYAVHATIERWPLLSGVGASGLSVTRNVGGIEIAPPLPPVAASVGIDAVKLPGAGNIDGIEFIPPATPVAVPATASHALETVSFAAMLESPIALLEPAETQGLANAQGEPMQGVTTHAVPVAEMDVGNDAHDLAMLFQRLRKPIDAPMEPLEPLKKLRLS